MDEVKRLFVEKKSGFDIAAQQLYADVKEYLGIATLTDVRLLIRYDIEGISDDDYQTAMHTIFAEPPADIVFDDHITLDAEEHMFAVEYLPGQYDQRADSAAQCIQIITHQAAPLVKTAQVVILKGNLTDADMDRVKKYLINPVDSHEAMLAKPETLKEEVDVPEDVLTIEGFIHMDDDAVHKLQKELDLAMNHDDLLFCQQYFLEEEKRDPTMTEIRMLDTYWSDHCRHTTFLTHVTDVSFEDHPLTAPIKAGYESYKASRDVVYGKETSRPITLMDIATMAMKEMRKQGTLDDLEVSDEINACSIVVPAEINGKQEDWLVMFKNETHNHPTEIEPFGGAATCLGGAIRDPLSGRSYVYQAMRLTGCGDPRTPLAQTLPGKLPQRKITVESAEGYSSYGNQIGLATGMVSEIYHEGYVAKRMEIGAVIAAAPKKNVVREKPIPGDIVILVGGRTGRDGCGGATGSSKEHTEESIHTCGAEVQKGNPPTERKIQRLFRNPTVSTMIKKCNDFGAGGVSVAIGELAEGLLIDLDTVPKKYKGLNGTELAISESQERMAVLVAKEHAKKFKEYAAQENLEAVEVAIVTEEPRVRMTWRSKFIVDISRDFINTNGVFRSMPITVLAPKTETNYFKAYAKKMAHVGDLKKAWLHNLSDLNVCSQQGLVERFDSTIGAGSVLHPFGGTHQYTPTEAMVAKLPVQSGDTTTGTIMSHGFDPNCSSWSPYHGAVYAVVQAVAKVVASGGDYSKIRLTLQEYFEKLGDEPTRWGKPLSALLGAHYAMKQFGIPAIGGKDSMSGTFENISVPPTLAAFAVCPVDITTVISPEFKKAGSTIVLLSLQRDQSEIPDFNKLKALYEKIHTYIVEKKIISAHTITHGGIAAALSKMSFGNNLGVRLVTDDRELLFSALLGSIICEIPSGFNPEDLFDQEGEYMIVGETIDEPQIRFNGTSIDNEETLNTWKQPLESIFPTQPVSKNDKAPERISYNQRSTAKPSAGIAQPRVLIPVFPGTNCEYDSARAFEKAGATVETFVIKNLLPEDIDNTLIGLAQSIDNAQIIMIPGGFSAGDEPDGSGKFIAAVFRNPVVQEAVTNLMENRDGLMLGICNGFQALIKLGLVPFGSIRDMDDQCPTLTFNTIGRHMSRMVTTRISSTLSPWFSHVNTGDLHTIPISHGEGRFVAEQRVLDTLITNGQVATQYVDVDGSPRYAIDANPNGSYLAIEGITSPDGRILGKMGHSERIGTHVAKNIPGNKDQMIFKAGVDYFK